MQKPQSWTKRSVSMTFTAARAAAQGHTGSLHGLWLLLGDIGVSLLKCPLLTPELVGNKLSHHQHFKSLSKRIRQHPIKWI